MTGSITKRTSTAPIGIAAAMCLSIILHQFEVVLLTEMTNLFRIGTSSIKMHQKDGTGLGRNQILQSTVIQFQCIVARLSQNRHQSVLRQSKDRGDIGISRYDNLVAWLHDAHFDVSSVDPYQRIQAVTTAYTKPTANIFGIVFLKALVLCTL